MYLEFDIFQPLWVKFKGESCDDKSRSVHFFWHNAHEKKTIKILLHPFPLLSEYRITQIMKHRVFTCVVLLGCVQECV